MTAIRGYGGPGGPVYVCDRCGVVDATLGPGDPQAAGWEGHRGGLGPHFCPECATGDVPAEPSGTRSGRR